MTTQPKVSVCMITYNHENYIGDAIEGVLMQKCNFEVELVVANDCSTDATDIIIEDILKNHQQASWIKYINHKENVGMMPNFIWVLNQCNSKYIALCEGDDYWTDPLKLQKQVDFLEGNKDCNLCFTQSNVLLPIGKITSGSFYNKSLKTSFEDIVFGNYITTLTVVFVRPVNGIALPDWYFNVQVGDWPLYMWLIKDGGYLYYLDDITAVYRKDIGISTNLRLVLSNLFLAELKILEFILNDPNFKNKQKIVKKSISLKLFSLMISYNREYKYFKAIGVFISLINKMNTKKLFKIYAYSIYVSIKKYLRLI